MTSGRPEAPPLELSRVTVHLGRQPVVSDVSLALAPGGWHALLGPNGSGKTTVMRAALGLLRPAEGWVRLLGAAPPAAPGGVGVSFGPRLLHPGRRVRTEVALRVQAVGGSRPDVEQAWEQTGLTDPRLPCGALSLGQAQRLSVVCALVGRPRLVVLDEPTVGLDALAQEWLRDRLRGVQDRGGALWVSSHDLAEVERSADTVAVLSGGRLVHDGDLAGLLADDGGVQVASSEPDRLQQVLSDAGARWVASGGGAVRVLGWDAGPLGRLLADRAVPLLHMATARTTLELRLRELVGEPVRAGVAP